MLVTFRQFEHKVDEVEFNAVLQPTDPESRDKRRETVKENNNWGDCSSFRNKQKKQALPSRLNRQTS